MERISFWLMPGSVHTVKENAEALVVATEETGLEVNADKTKYMVVSQDRNAGRGHSVKIDNSSIERVEEFKYLGMALTDQNSIQEEIKSKLKLGNACFHSVAYPEYFFGVEGGCHEFFLWGFNKFS
jgi:hypothetical protein